jgi:hypothetical protein
MEFCSLHLQVRNCVPGMQELPSPCSCVCVCVCVCVCGVYRYIDIYNRIIVLAPAFASGIGPQINFWHLTENEATLWTKPSLSVPPLPNNYVTLN